MSLPDGASMKRITTARVREYAALPVTAGRALALATVPTMMFCLSPLSRALADDYFDPAALEFADPQQQTSDLHYFAKPGGQQPGTYLSPWWLTTRSWVRPILRLLTMAGSCSRC
jgi:outer membrane usher protein